MLNKEHCCLTQKCCNVTLDTFPFTVPKNQKEDKYNREKNTKLLRLNFEDKAKAMAYSLTELNCPCSILKAFDSFDYILNEFLLSKVVLELCDRMLQLPS